ncbi:hypothetical protein HOS59_gp35 [Streptomyces phage Rowa]|uniref:Uncharacterized protein n=1 Tax=Streptomyces phage Rowa TaxID=2059883 RepID=A0A2H5BLT9_9CAUD|nr:hypothetical protein HOS59_gp35 [Streptomyces phage Rowa]AUG87299.1 hypothetical protein SEA_ROWA_35 [Streptomyces phage Rowa]
MAKITPGNVLVDLSPTELALVRKALRVMQNYAEYADQAECDALSQLMLDLREGA